MDRGRAAASYDSGSVENLTSSVLAFWTSWTGSAMVGFVLGFFICPSPSPDGAEVLLYNDVAELNAFKSCHLGYH